MLFQLFTEHGAHGDAKEYWTLPVNRFSCYNWNTPFSLHQKVKKWGTEKPEYDNRNVCCCFFKQRKTLNMNHCTPKPDYSTVFTSSSPKTSLISSRGDKEATEEKAVSLSTASLTLQHWLSVICSGHLSDTQHPASLHGKEVLKHPTPVPKRYHLTSSTCPSPALGHG